MRSHVTCLVLLTLSFAPLLRADDTPTPLPTLKMDAALRAAHPDEAGVTLAVDAAKVSLPDSTVLPGDPMTGQQTGALYGQTTQTFGSVLAVAPPTITVVYSPPGTPNPYDGMPPGQVMKLLAATFTLAQWKAFMSPLGVAYTDMAGDTQTALFQALFPDGHLVFVQNSGDTKANGLKPQQDLSGEALAAAHLRLGSTTTVCLPYRGGYSFRSVNDGQSLPPRYTMQNAPTQHVAKEYGAQVRETVPNTSKIGQLAFDAPALKTLVPLTHIRTVADLIVRIGLTTRREIYADPRYGPRLVTLVLPAGPPSAPAADLLQALALCVGGTYRQVGPAYVLTDDVIGLGTKQAAWKAFEEKAQKMLPGGGDTFYTPVVPDAPYTLLTISDDSDPLALTPMQKNDYWQKQGMDMFQGGSSTLRAIVPFSQLNPAQKQNAEEQAEEQAGGGEDQATLDGMMQVDTQAEVEVLLPALDGPVIIPQGYQNLLPLPSSTPAQQEAQRKRMEAEFPAPTAPALNLPQAMRGFLHRAAQLPLPKTPAEASRSFAALQALGFNQAWVRITPGSAADDNSLRGQLSQAAAEGHKRGIAVFPDISLLHWDKDTAPDLLDCDIQGQTLVHHFGTDIPCTISPFAPAAAARLASLIQTLGTVPGVSGMAWDNVVATGYENYPRGINVSTSFGETPLGYTESGRLAFLRVDHTDPVDIYDSYSVDERAQVQVPGFDADHPLMTRLCIDWRSVRAAASQRFLHQLIAALPAPFKGPQRLPLLTAPDNPMDRFSYAPWPHPVQVGLVPSAQVPAAAYSGVLVFAPPYASPSAWKSNVLRVLQIYAKQGERNVVLDFTGQPELLQDKDKASRQPRIHSKKDAASAASSELPTPT